MNSEQGKQILDIMLEGVAILDFDWRYSYVNPAQETTVRQPKEELLGFTIIEKFPGFEKTELFQVFNTCMRERVSRQIEDEFVFPDGDVRHFEFNIKPVSDGILIMSIDITERKIIKSAQKKASDFYRSVMEHALDVIYILDGSEHPRFLDMNKVGLELLGYSKEEILKMTTYDIIFEEEFDHSKSKIAVVREGGAIRIDRKFKKKDGSAVDVELTANKMEDGNMFVVARDVSQRKADELQLIRSEMRFRSLIENSKDGISLLDEKFNTLYRSPSASKMLGWTNEELDEMGTLKNIHPDDVSEVGVKMTELLSNPGKSIDVWFRFHHKEGHYLRMEGVALNLLHNEYVNAIVFNFRDITIQKAAEENLKVSELYYRSIIEQANEAIYIVEGSPAGKFTDINQSGCIMLGYTKDEFLALNAADLLFQEDHSEDPAKRKEFGSGFDTRVERKLKRKDGSAVETECSGKMLSDGNFIVFVRDISERKKAERELLKLNEELESRVGERTKEFESFSYSVSHDLRAPLRAVNGYAQMLAEDFDTQLGDEGKRIIATIRANARKMGMLIDDLLAFSKLGLAEVQKSDVDLSDLVSGVLVEVNKSIKHSAEIRIGTLHKLKGDYNLLSQVVFNLISNALKYSSKRERPVVELFSEVKEGEVVFSVRDNGVGFDMLYYDKLFGVFQRLHLQEEFEGTGVGLAIVQRIIAKHGGKVWAEGKLDEGATFSFKLSNR